MARSSAVSNMLRNTFKGVVHIRSCGSLPAALPGLAGSAEAAPSQKRRHQIGEPTMRSARTLPKTCSLIRWERLSPTT